MNENVESAVKDIIAELEQNGVIQRLRMSQISRGYLGDEACTDLEGEWAIPMAVLVHFRKVRPAAARFRPEQDAWVLA